MPMTHDEVFDKVRTVLVDALVVDEEDVKPDAKISADLGAESIDYLDIVFRLEKAFNIKIQQGEMMPDNVMNDPKFVQDGKITDLGIAELRKRMPYVPSQNFDALDKNRSVEEFMNLFTVETIVRFVQQKLA